MVMTEQRPGCRPVGKHSVDLASGMLFRLTYRFLDCRQTWPADRIDHRSSRDLHRCCHSICSPRFYPYHVCRTSGSRSWCRCSIDGCPALYLGVGAKSHPRLPHRYLPALYRLWSDDRLLDQLRLYRASDWTIDLHRPTCPPSSPGTMPGRFHLPVS